MNPSELAQSVIPEAETGWRVVTRRARRAWQNPGAAALSCWRELRAQLLVRAPVGLRQACYRKPADWADRSFNEKLRWRCSNPDPKVDYCRWVDKALVKELVRPFMKAAESYDLVSGPEQIDVRRLPGTYVMKATHGWNMSLLVRDGVIQGQNRAQWGAGQPANNTNLQEIARTWWSPGQDRSRRELHYRFLPRRILFEEYLEPIDYEVHFFLFSGSLSWTTVIKGGFRRESGRLLQVFDENWCRVPLDSPRSVAAGEDWSGVRPPKTLVESLQSLCKHIDQVRVDYYLVVGEPYFSEFTFTHGAGSGQLLARYDALLGELWRD